MHIFVTHVLSSVVQKNHSAIVNYYIFLLILSCIFLSEEWTIKVIKLRTGHFAKVHMAAQFTCLLKQRGGQMLRMSPEDRLLPNELSLGLT